MERLWAVSQLMRRMNRICGRSGGGGRKRFLTQFLDSRSGGNFKQKLDTNQVGARIQSHWDLTRPADFH